MKEGIYTLDHFYLEVQSITTKLNNKIYEKLFKPNYRAEVGE